jgi:hypothetical protein
VRLAPTGKLVSLLRAAGMAILLAAMGTPAGAQPAPARALPIAVDLRAIEVGRWAEYAFDANGAQLRQKFALVERHGPRIALEVTLDGQPLAAVGRVLMQLTSEGDITRPGDRQMILQVADRPPVAIAPGAPLAPQTELARLDPATFVAEETVTVPAGKLRARRHHWTSAGLSMDVWTSAAVGPLGLVRLQATPMASGVSPARIELVSYGLHASSQLRGPVTPYSDGALERALRPTTR